MSFNHSAKRKSDSTNFMFSRDSLTVVHKGSTYNFRLDERTKKSECSYIKGNKIEDKYSYYFALDVYQIYNLRLILTDKEEINSENKDFIEDLKELSTQEKRCFIIFDKQDVTLKIDIDEVKMKMIEQEFCSKVDAKINNKIESEDIIEMLKHIPNHLAIKLEADKIEQIIELMKSKILIEKLRKQRTNFLYSGIEIKPRIIKSKMDEKDLKSEVVELATKRVRLNMDCDEVEKKEAKIGKLIEYDFYD